MSYAATHDQHHVHVPWTPIIAVAVAVAVAAAILILVNQPATQPSTAQQTAVAPLAANAEAAAAVPAPESPALRRQIATDLSARAIQGERFSYPRNHVVGATAGTFAGARSAGAGGTATRIAPDDPHPFNHFPSEP